MNDELIKMEKEKRKFTIIRRERALSDAQKAKNLAAIVTGAFFLSTMASVIFNNANINEVVQHEMEAVYSWEALVEYFKDLGPLTTILSAGTALNLVKYFRASGRLKHIQDEIADFNASLEKEDAKTLGGKK